MTVDSANEARTWRPMDIAALAARLGVVTALGFAYWHTAFLSVLNRLGDDYDAPNVVSSAHAIPNTSEVLAAFLGIAVTISICALGWSSRSIARRVSRIVALALLPLCLGLIVLTNGWWALLFSVGFAIIGITVVGALGASGLIRLPSAGTSDHLKWDRYNAVTLLFVSIAAGVLVSMVVALTGLKERSVVLPEFGEVVILRSDSVGHFALDDDGQLMWLSRSKVDMIMVAPKSDDETTTSENP